MWPTFPLEQSCLWIGLSPQGHCLKQSWVFRFIAYAPFGSYRYFWKGEILRMELENTSEMLTGQTWNPRAAGNNDGVQMALDVGEDTPSVKIDTLHHLLWVNLGPVRSSVRVHCGSSPCCPCPFQATRIGGPLKALHWTVLAGSWEGLALWVRALCPRAGTTPYWP